ncbi:Alpha/beta hydrolase family protein [Paenibacillus konkukensis]|uniref:Alpha/beta hydrolase family protein n=1 Tax=Paenibacillus konkukensis TaxID=2020716 RepID=A0ABY4RXZ5_9BACL|nr:prolyl oligopeptidase family serine peptidase [Paenibacillus konkukensis]UQZ86546.1 Alpha/beta hydrolase family protein [Paenibacillus konkukensis]
MNDGRTKEKTTVGAGGGAVTSISEGAGIGWTTGGGAQTPEAAGESAADSCAASSSPGEAFCRKREPLRSRYRDILLYRLTYVSEGLRVKGYLAVPAAASALSPYLGLIYCRGGIRKVGMVRKRRIMSMARRGYCVFAPFYRGNEGGEGREDFGGEDRYDVCHAITLVRSLPEVKRGPVPLIGFSRGAMMALLAAKQCPDAGPVVVWGGVSDLFHTYEERVDLRRMLKRVVGHPRKQSEAYEERSPVYWLERISVPVMIVHGTVRRSALPRRASWRKGWRERARITPWSCMRGWTTVFRRKRTKRRSMRCSAGSQGSWRRQSRLDVPLLHWYD